MKNGKRDGLWTYYNREAGAEYLMKPFFDRSANRRSRGFKTPWYRKFLGGPIELVTAEYELRADTVYEETQFSAPFYSNEAIKKRNKGVLTVQNGKNEWVQIGSEFSKCANAEIINRKYMTRTTGCFCETSDARYKSGLFEKFNVDDGRIVSTSTYRQGYRSGPSSWYNYSEDEAESASYWWEQNYTNAWFDDGPARPDWEKYWEAYPQSRRTAISRRNGPAKNYYIDGGQLREEVTYVHDNREGPFTRYWPTGEVMLEGNFLDDDWSGPVIQRLKNGHIKYVTNWSNEVKDGFSYDFWFAFDGTQGNLRSEEFWVQGTKQYEITHYNQPSENWGEPRIELSVEVDGSDTPLERTFAASWRFVTKITVDFIPDDEAIFRDEEAWGNWLRKKIINPEFLSAKLGEGKSYAPCYDYDEFTLCGQILDGERIGTWFYTSGDEEEELLRPGRAPFISNDGDTTGLVLTWSKGMTFENEKAKHGPSILIESKTNTFAYFTYEDNLRQGYFASIRVDDEIIMMEEGSYEDDIKNGPFEQALWHCESIDEEPLFLTGRYENGKREYDGDDYEAIKKELREAGKFQQ